MNEMEQEARTRGVVARDVQDEALAWPERAKTIVVRDAATYQHAAGSLFIIKALITKIQDAYNPHIQRAHEAHKALIVARNEQTFPLVEAEQTLKQALALYDAEQAMLREAEERRLRELSRQQEEQRRLDEAALLEREAHATGDSSKLAEARELLAQPIDVAPIILPTTTPKVAGLSHRDSWSARVINLGQLVHHVGEHPELLNLVQPNQPALNAMARAQRERLKLPGVEAINTPGVAVGKR